MRRLDMQQTSELRIDAASAISQGMRDYQEDAVVADFPLGADFGFVVLADGMGGHAAGDVASKIVMTEVFSELKFQSGAPNRFSANVTNILRDAADGANACIDAHVQENPDAEGMGATLVATVLVRNDLFWISVGDSPIYLFREGQLTQLNEDHSMAPQIDFMVESGLLDAELAKDHPDRNCLTSVLSGRDIPRIDCPEDPVVLQDGDIVIVSSDGLQFLSNAQIATVLEEAANEPASDIASALLDGLEALEDPDQDNISMTVMKVSHGATRRAGTPVIPFSERRADDEAAGGGSTVLPRRITNGTGKRNETTFAAETGG